MTRMWMVLQARVILWITDVTERRMRRIAKAKANHPAGGQR